MLIAGVSYGRRFGLSQLEGGRRGRDESGYKAGSERVTTHMEAADGYVKEIWLVSGWAMGWQVKTIVL